MRRPHKVKARDYREAAISQGHLELLEIGKGKKGLSPRVFGGRVTLPTS